MLTPDFTKQFKRDYKLSEKRNLDLSLIDEIIEDLIKENQLHKKHKDHALKGEYKDIVSCFSKMKIW